MNKISTKWPVQKLGDLIDFKNGYAFNSKDYSADGIIVLRMSNVGVDGRLNVNSNNIKRVPENVYRNLSDFELKKGDLVMAMTDVSKELGVVGKTAIVDENNCYILNQRVGRIRPNEQLNPEYLHVFTNSTFFLDRIHQKVTGSAQYNLSTYDIKESPIPVPSITIQRKIAQIFNSIDKQIQSTDRIIQKTEFLKQGLMIELFEELLELSVFIKLGNTTNFIDYRGKTPKKSPSGIPLITAKNVRMGFVDPEPREYIQTENYDSWMTRGIPNMGDVLFTTEAPLGNVAQLNTAEKVAFAQRVIIIQPKPDIDSTFLKYLLMNPTIQDKIQSLSSGGTVKGIKAKVLKQITIPIPPKSKQVDIASILSAIDSKIEKEKECRRVLEIIKKGLMQDIFTRKVEVN